MSRLVSKKSKGAAAVMAGFALIATSCGSSTPAAAPEPEIVEVEVPGEEVIVEVEVPGEEVIVEVEVPGETVSIEPITFWSTETQPARLEITNGIIDRFTAETGIEVVLVAAGEDQLPSLMAANAASGSLPDVVFHPVDFTVGWAAQGLLDTAATDKVVASLGADTFSQGALDLVKVDGNVAGVPSDGWGQLLLYRSDLFEAAGLDAPTTFEKMSEAAIALNDPANNFYGITAATDAGAVFTQQTFEHFALANGCELVDDSGTVTLDSPNCVEAIDFFATLMDSSPGGLQDVVGTRATYFAGQSSMIVWSPFILDEMAGLRDAALPSCQECAENLSFLAENTGIVPAFSGPSGDPAQYGQISYLGITVDADVPAAQAFIEFWLSDGYIDWLSTSPEGKFPMRRGSANNPTEYLDSWRALETGVDRKASLVDFYGEDVMNTLIEGSDNFSRWGFNQGQGELVTAVYSALPVPAAVSEVLDGRLSAEEAAASMQAAAEEELELLQDG